MNAKNQKTLKKVFQEPPPLDLAWSDIEEMLKEFAESLKGNYSSGSTSGARTRVRLNEVIGIFEYPQRPNASTIRDVREFLMKARIRP